VTQAKAPRLRAMEPLVFPHRAGELYRQPSAGRQFCLQWRNDAGISLIRRHILFVPPETLNSPYKLLAADVNGDGKVTTADIASVRKLILGATNVFPAGLCAWCPPTMRSRTSSIHGVRPRHELLQLAERPHGPELPGRQTGRREQLLESATQPAIAAGLSSTAGKLRRASALTSPVPHPFRSVRRCSSN